MADDATPVTIRFTLDGREVEANKGEMLIAAAERSGTYIPRFCYHPRMEPVGVCRMCLVEVEGPRGTTLMPSCYIAPSDGMVVRTDSEKVKKAQDGVLEFLLANHPLDCPVCDKGGECPLQDQTLAYGPGESRFIEEKRHFEKPVPISDLVLLDRERCIQCSRCTRFAAEVAGEAQITFSGRGDLVEVAPFPTEPFTSHFSGNTVQICPVGALTAKPYRFAARPWDLDQAESTCTGCSVGCRVAVQSSQDRLTRVLGVDGEVSHGWLCDKGRFGFEAVTGAHDADSEPGRVTSPMLKKNGELVPVTWSEALSAAAAALSTAGSAVGVIGGAQFTNEGAYAWAKLAKGVIGTDSVDAQLNDGLPASLVFGLPAATILDLDTASAILTITGDLSEELPVLFLRLREAAHRGTPIVQIHQHPDSVTSIAHSALAVRSGDTDAVVRMLCGDDVQAAQLRNHPEGLSFDPVALEAAKAALPHGGKGLVVIVGRENLAEDGTLTAAAAKRIAGAFPEATFLVGLRRANVRGALDLGLTPGFLPGRVTLAEGQSRYAGTWATTPSATGLSTVEQLRALATGAAGAPSVLVLLGADPLTDLPDGALAAAGLAKATTTIVVSGHHTATTAQADIVLPVTVANERTGTTTNVEGRVSVLAPAVAAPGQAWSDWTIAAALADALGADLGLETVDAFAAEIAALAPSHRGLSAQLLAGASGDGIIIPVGSSPIHGAQPLDPTAFPGVKAVTARPLGMEQASLPEGAPASGGAALLAAIPEAVSMPGPDGYALRLTVQRRLYDGGATVTNSPSLAPLVDGATVKVHPSALDRLGVASGTVVRLRSAAAHLDLPAISDKTVIKGTAVLSFNHATADHAGNAAASLIDASAVVTDVRMETR